MIHYRSYLAATLLLQLISVFVSAQNIEDKLHLLLVHGR